MPTPIEIEDALEALIGQEGLAAYKKWVADEADKERDWAEIFNKHRAALTGTFAVREGALWVVLGDSESEAKDFDLPLSSFGGDWRREWDACERKEVGDLLQVMADEARKD